MACASQMTLTQLASAASGESDRVQQRPALNHPELDFEVAHKMSRECLTLRHPGKILSTNSVILTGRSTYDEDGLC